MKKLLFSLGVGLLALTGLTARAQSGVGKLTASGQYYDSGWKDTEVSIDVNGTYQSNFKGLTIIGINMPGGKTSYTNPLYVKLDPATGNVTGTAQLAYKYGNNNDFPCYYANYNEDPSAATNIITGKLKNTGANESTLTLSEWGDLMYVENQPSTWNQGKWIDTKIVFNFAIPDLPEYDPSAPEPDEPEPEHPTVNYMTANYGKADGEKKVYEPVTGIYDKTAKTITLTGVAGKADEYVLTLKVDSEGNLESIGNEISKEEDDYIIYYSDIAKSNNQVYGKVKNLDETCEITLDPWGDYYANWEDGAFDAYDKWYNTYIVLNQTIELPAEEVDPEPEPDDPEPQPGDDENVFIGQKDGMGMVVFEDTNPLGVKFGLYCSAKGSYGNYFKLGWTSNSIYSYSTDNDQNLFYFVLPATIDPKTKEVTVNDYTQTLKNHIKFDFTNDSKEVYQDLYAAAGNNDNGSPMENSCVAVVSYTDLNRTNLNKVERAFYLKGGEFLGDVDGNMPSLTSFGGIDLKANTQYRWKLDFEEITLGEAPTFDGIQNIEGTWTFPMDDTLYVDTPLGKANVTYIATLDGTTVTFIEDSDDSQFPMVAQFIDSTTLRFSQAVVNDKNPIDGSPLSNPIKQSTFLNTEQVNYAPEPGENPQYGPLVAAYQPIDATYDSEKGTLTFPENSGILWVAAPGDSYTPTGSSFSPQGYYIAAVDFSGVATFAGAVEPSMTIKNHGEPEVEGTDVTVTIDVYPAYFTPAEGATWTVTVTEVQGEETVGTKTYPATIGTGKNLDGDDVTTATFEMTGLSTGRHTFNIALKYENGDMTVTSSNSASLAVEVGSFLEITNVVGTPDYTKGVVNITFDVTSYNVPEGATYNVVITPMGEEADDDDIQTFADNSITIPATVTDGKGTAQLSGLKLAAGSYAYQFVVNALSGSKVVATTGNLVTPTLEFTLEENLMPGNGPTGLLRIGDGTSFTLSDTDTEAEEELGIYLILDDFDDTMEYQGYQFDITFPAGIELTGAESGLLDEDIKVEISEPVVGDGTVSYRVVSYFKEPTDETGLLVTLNLRATYGKIEGSENGTKYDVTIDNTVIFSSALGEDITSILGSEGTITIYEEISYVHATGAAIDSAIIAAPSYSQAKMANAVTVGEAIDLDITISGPEGFVETVADFVWYDGEDEIDYAEYADGLWTISTEGLEEGEYTITGVLGETEVEVEYTFTVNAILLGDSNDNGKVNVADAVTVANVIANKDYATIGDVVVRFDYPNANVTADDDIDARDITGIINIVLGRPLNVRRQTRMMNVNDALVASNFGAGMSTVAVTLDNTYEYAALQATIVVPEGVNVLDVTKGARAAAHEMIWSRTSEGNINVVLFSLGNGSFADSNDALFNLVVDADANAGDIRMEDILASDAQSNGYELDFAGGLNAGTNGIYGIDADNADTRYFTIDGVEVSNPEKGQILIRVQNGEAVKVVK